MSVVVNFRSVYENAEQWLRDHDMIYWFGLAVIPGGMYALSQILISDAPLMEAVVLGIVFGVVFAALPLAVRWWYRS